MHERRRVLTVPLMLSLALPASAAGQAARQEIPVFKAGVSVVAVPVFVTDKNGKAVPGLTMEQFEVEEQGRKVPIVAFYAVDAGAPAALVGAGSVTQAAARRQFLFLFDLTFSTLQGLQRAQKAALELARGGLAPGDLASVATFGSAGVRMLLGFTSDRVQLARAIETLGVLDPDRPRDPLALAYDMTFLQREGAGIAVSHEEGRKGEFEELMRQQGLQIERSERRMYTDRAEGFISGLQGLSTALDAVQGRKQVVLLSAGFDQSVLLGATGEKAIDNATAAAQGRLWEVDSGSHFGEATARNRMDELFRALAASDVVIHSVDLGGLATRSSEAGDAGRSFGASGRESLAQLAINSGGRFVTDANEIGDAFREVLDATRYYYVIAFEPADAGKKKGQLRKLDVKVRGGGMQVAHRRAYALPDPERAADAGSRQLQAAEAIAKGLSGGAIGLRAVAVPYRNGQGRIALPVVLEIDGPSLLEKAGKGKMLQVEVYGYELDATGRIQDLLALNPTLDLGQLEASLRQKGLQVLTSFRAAPGRHDLRFLVRETASGRSGSLRLLVDVPGFEPAGTAVSLPLLMDDPRSRVVLPTASRGNPTLEIPFRLGDVPFTLDGWPLLRTGASREACVLVYRGAEAAGAALELVPELVDAAGQAHPLEVEESRVVRDADGTERRVLKLAFRGVERGEYQLQVRYAGPSGPLASAAQAVRVE